MTMNQTPSANRVHIAFFGRRNAGKSSLLNAVTGQSIAVVSQVLGTTTDPVQKSMELLPLGPVVMIDTPGFDDEGELGSLRVKKAKQVLAKTDVAVLVAEAGKPLGPVERELLELFRQRELPFLIARSKADLSGRDQTQAQDGEIYVSAQSGQGIVELKERLAALGRRESEPRLVGDLLRPGQLAVLVTPIDASAPKGRIILPQQQVLRDVLDADAVALVTKEFQLKEALEGLKQRPAMVITDSQVFGRVAAEVPQEIPLTSFSILMARYKGLLETAVRGVAAIDRLRDGDRILVAEGCTHHRQCEDIGTVKLPAWLRRHTGKELSFETSSGVGFPEDLSPYSLVLHCGGCMLNEREVQHRMRSAVEQGVPITNYGTAIAFVQGILRRSLSLFPELLRLLDGTERS